MVKTRGRRSQHDGAKRRRRGRATAREPDTDGARGRSPREVMSTALDQRTTVLLVEDEESFVEALVVGLQREGFRVEVARDGIEAIEQFERVDPDVILLDVMLPRMGGIDVCRQIRTTSNVPIIMVTAKASEIDTVVGLEVGADDYVSKPYRLR